MTVSTFKSRNRKINRNRSSSGDTPSSMVRDWVEAKFLPVVSQHHRDGTFPIDVRRDLGEMGVFGATLKGYGCAGLDNVSYGLIMT